MNMPNSIGKNKSKVCLSVVCLNKADGANIRKIIKECIVNKNEDYRYTHEKTDKIQAVLEELE